MTKEEMDHTSPKFKRQYVWRYGVHPWSHNECWKVWYVQVLEQHTLPSRWRLSKGQLFIPARQYKPHSACPITVYSHGKSVETSSVGIRRACLQSRPVCGALWRAKYDRDPRLLNKWIHSSRENGKVSKFQLVVYMVPKCLLSIAKRRNVKWQACPVPSFLDCTAGIQFRICVYLQK